MDSCSVKFGMGFRGTVTGASGASTRTADIANVVRCVFTGSGKMVYDAASSGNTFTIAAGGTTTLDLNTGLTSPLGESIAGALDFTSVWGLMVVHDGDSVATGTITVFGGASVQQFQGLLASGSKAQLLKGRGIGFVVEDDQSTGMTVDGTHHNIDIVNDSAETATVRVFIFGKTSG